MVVMNFIEKLAFVLLGERGVIRAHCKIQPKAFEESFVKWRLEDTLDYIEDNETIDEEWAEHYGRDLLSRISFYSPEWLPSLLDIRQAEQIANKIIEDSCTAEETTEPCDVVYTGKVEKVMLLKPRGSAPFVSVKFSHPVFRYYESKMLNEKWTFS